MAWRDYWFVKSVLRELPIVGGFFASEKVGEMLYHAGHSAAMIGGGTFGMMFNAIATPQETDDRATVMAKMTANMIVGSTLTTMTYNSIIDYAILNYRYCKQGSFFPGTNKNSFTEIQSSDSRNNEEMQEEKDTNTFSAS